MRDDGQPPGALRLARGPDGPISARGTGAAQLSAHGEIRRPAGAARRAYDRRDEQHQVTARTPGVEPTSASTGRRLGGSCRRRWKWSICARAV